jgi:hypothetical protein
MDNTEKAREVRSRLKLLESTEQRDAFTAALEALNDFDAANVAAHAAHVRETNRHIGAVGAMELLAKVGMWWAGVEDAPTPSASTLTSPSLSARVREYLKGMEQ